MNFHNIYTSIIAFASRQIQKNVTIPLLKPAKQVRNYTNKFKRLCITTDTT